GQLVVAEAEAHRLAVLRREQRRAPERREEGRGLELDLLLLVLRDHLLVGREVPLEKLRRERRPRAPREERVLLEGDRDRRVVRVRDPREEPDRLRRNDPREREPPCELDRPLAEREPLPVGRDEPQPIAAEVEEDAV